MRVARSIVGLGLLAFALLSAGCGGGGGGSGPSLTTDYTNAVNNPNPEVAATELVRVAYAFKKAGDVARAERAANDAAGKAAAIKDPVGQGIAFRDIATVQGYLGMRGETKAALKQAQAAAEKIDTPDRKADVLGQVGVVYGNYLNETENAKYWLEMAEKAVAAATDPAEKTRGLIAVAYFYNKWKSDDGKAGAERLAKAAREAAVTIPDGRAKSEVLADIGVKLDQMKRPEDAKAVFEEAATAARAIPQDASKTHAICNLAKLMAPTRRAEALALVSEAEKIKEKIADPGLKTEVEATIEQLKRDL